MISGSLTGVHSRISGVGSYLPPRILKNSDLSSFMETSDEWIRSRTGIEQRHWVTGTTATSDLALEAARVALADAHLSADQIDLILLATTSPDYDLPPAACFLQRKLGLNNIPAMDVRQACASFVYGMSIADAFIKTGTYKNILLVGAETQSKALDKSTRGRDMAVLFGDGAGAIVLSASDDPFSGRIFSTHLHTDGSHAEDLWIPSPSCAADNERMSRESFERGDHFPRMEGKVVFQNAVKRMPEAIDEALQANGMKMEDIDLFLFHQANLRINEMVAKRLGIPDSKVFNTIQKYGNTTAATLPLGMDTALRAGKLKRGMTVAMAAFGSGFSWGSTIFRY